MEPFERRYDNWKMLTLARPSVFVLADRMGISEEDMLASLFPVKVWEWGEIEMQDWVD